MSSTPAPRVATDDSRKESDARSDVTQSPYVDEGDVIGGIGGMISPFSVLSGDSVIKSLQYDVWRSVPIASLPRGGRYGKRNKSTNPKPGLGGESIWPVRRH